MATVEDAAAIAGLLDDFNSEFETPTPGRAVLAERLLVLLAQDCTFAIVDDRAAVAVALVTVRTNVWYRGAVALLDEMYVAPGFRDRGIGSAIMGQLITTCAERGIDLIEINVDEGDVDAQRFYERHGFSSTEPGSAARAWYFSQEVTPGLLTPGR